MSRADSQNNIEKMGSERADRVVGSKRKGSEAKMPRLRYRILGKVLGGRATHLQQ
jgi:hypothetical protein